MWLMLTKIINCLGLLVRSGPLLLNAEVPGECMVSDLGLACLLESVCPNPWNEL